jgi:hypothetical protein
MKQHRFFLRCVAGSVLAAFSLQLWAQDVTIVVDRLGKDKYAVVKGKNLKPGELILETKYCHAYARNEEALFLTREEQNGDAAMIYFATGDQCEVVKVENTTDSSFSLIDLLIQLGMIAATKGKTPIAKPKR